MENSAIAAIFEETANVLKILQDDPKWSFKAAAYERAKRSIESYSERLDDVARDPNRKLTDIPGVGADFAAKIVEIVQTGRLQYLEEKLQHIDRFWNCCTSRVWVRRRCAFFTRSSASRRWPTSKTRHEPNACAICRG